MEEDIETKVYNLIKSTDAKFILINKYEIDLFTINKIQIKGITFNIFDSYSKAIDSYLNKNEANIYILCIDEFTKYDYDSKKLENVDIHIIGKFNSLKYLSKFTSEIIIEELDDQKQINANNLFIETLKNNYMTSLFLCSYNTGIVGVEGYYDFHDKFYKWLPTVTNIYIINANVPAYSRRIHSSYGSSSSFSSRYQYTDFSKILNSEHKNKIKYLDVYVGKLYQTNPELIAYYRSPNIFGHVTDNYLYFYYNFNRTLSKINEQIIIGTDSYKYINLSYKYNKNCNNDWFPTNEITHIINVSNDPIDPSEIPSNSITYEHYPISESEEDNSKTKEILFKATERLHELLENKANIVYIHCSLGVNRSPAVVLLYFIKYHSLSLYQALKLISIKRRIFTSTKIFDIIYKEANGLNEANDNQISPLKLRTNYAINFCEPTAFYFSLYDVIYLENLYT